MEDWGRFDLDVLSDWPDEVAHELSRMRMFAHERLDAIREQLAKRVKMSLGFRYGKAYRVPRAIHDTTNLPEPNPDVDPDGIHGMDVPNLGI